MPTGKGRLSRETHFPALYSFMHLLTSKLVVALPAVVPPIGKDMRGEAEAVGFEEGADAEGGSLTKKHRSASTQTERWINKKTSKPCPTSNPQKTPCKTPQFAIQSTTKTHAKSPQNIL
jgi:hypothetical protein